MKKPFFLVLVYASLLFLLSSLSCFAQSEAKLKRSRRPIPNNYIVILENEDNLIETLLPSSKVDRIRSVANDLSVFYGGKVTRVYSSSVQGFSVEMSPEQADKLSGDRRVKYVEEDFVVTAEDTQLGAPYPLDRIDQRFANLDGTYTYDTSGVGVHVYIVDTGIRSTHIQFGGRVVFDADFVGDGQNGNDCNGHGTHVAGLVGGATYGVAKNVTIHNVRVLGCDGSGTGSAVLAAVDWITSNHVSPAVANMSRHILKHGHC